jgi:hypothetical protein
MNKRSTDVTWKVMFGVRIRPGAFAPGIDGWEVFNIHNDAIMGTYRDPNYATKQARRKYKKFIKLMEKSLMSIDLA